MRTAEFRRHIAPSLTPRGVSSYLSNCGRVERSLGIDLDHVGLEAADIARIGVRLHDLGIGGAPAANCLTAVRTYANFREAAPTMTVVTPPPPPKPTVRPHSEKSVAQLMRMYAEVLGELRSRGITRTANGPVGDYAEHLFAYAFRWELLGAANSGHDATDVAGTRYQIKARRITAANPSRQLSALRRLPDKPFDVVAAVLFDEDVLVIRAVLIPYEIVMAEARRVELTNSWRLMLSDRVCALPGVKDVTPTLQAASKWADEAISA